MKKLLHILVLALITPVFSLAQSDFLQKPLILKNHRIYIQDGFEQLKFGPNEVVNGKVYRIIQETNTKHFNLSGKFSIDVLSYLPDNAFSISIPISELQSLESTLIQLNARVTKWQPEWKLSPRLFKSDIPEWAWVDNKHIQVWIHTFPDLTPEESRSLITSQGLTIDDENVELGTYAVSIKPEQAILIAAWPFVNYLQEMEDPGTPENYTARTNHRVNYLQAQYPGTPGYDGTGVTVGHGDDGAIDFHVDFQGRLTVNSPPSIGDHGDHVAGTIFGAGNKDPKARGMAPGAQIYYQDYPDNLNGVDNNFTQRNVRITSSSYSNGCNAGYTYFTRQMDMDMEQNPTLLHVFSAGNNGTSDCGYGAGSGWGNVTGGHKIAKNVVTVANLRSTDQIVNSSSRGPSEDGRIKPDVSAVGYQVKSTTDLPVPNSYTSKTGTSMSCPGVSGTLATLYQAYRDVHGVDPQGSLLKGILQNTCEDLGNPGPDFIFGYGRINARRALSVIQGSHFMSDSISGTTKNFTLSIPTNGVVKQVRIMLIWPDPAASTTAGKVLVNDLDLVVTQDSNSYQPWVLDPTPNSANLNANAVRARDSLNNVEQVTIDNPSASNISLDVSAFNLPSAGQKFFITYEFVMEDVVLTYPIGGEGLVPGEVELIRWDASEGTTTFNVQYSIDNGSTWTTIVNASSSTNTAIWTVPNAPTKQALVKITRGTQTSTSLAPFTIVGVPGDLEFSSQCPDSATLSWRPATGANGYIVHQLGTKYMDSIAYTTDTFYTFQINKPTDRGWYSVSATIDSVAGRRAIAIEKPTDVFNCNLNDDVSVIELKSPQPGLTTDCFDYYNSPVKILLANYGTSDVSNFDVTYQINGRSPITETVMDTISANDSLVYTFTPSANINAGSNFYVSAWSSYSIDQNIYNDTVQERVIILPGSSITPPYTQDFENFYNCGINSDCSDGQCTLYEDWWNIPNITLDDIDWRTNNGTTPSNGTGPSIDANPGTTAGKYLYLESSDCFDHEAVLNTPCIDLTDPTITTASASYQYHMYGSNMGTLDVDIITEDKSYKSVHPTISGNQNFQWILQSIDLTPYVGKKIIIQFRGRTGDNYRSDIAIDDFKVEAPGIGLTDETPLSNLSLYPNPNNGSFKINLGSSYTGELNVSISTVTGNQVLELTKNINQQTEFYLSSLELAKGAYIITVTTSEGTGKLKMMKQ